MYNHKVVGLSLGESFPPHKEFWLSLPGLVYDGCVFSMGLIAPWINKLRSAQPVEHAVDTMAGDAAILDDQVDEDF